MRGRIWRKAALSRRTAAVGERGDGVRALSLRMAALSRHSSAIAGYSHSACLPAVVRIAARATSIGSLKEFRAHLHVSIRPVKSLRCQKVSGFTVTIFCLLAIKTGFQRRAHIYLAPGRARGASYNKRLSLNAICPIRRTSSSLRARERHHSQRMLEPYAHHRRLSDGCRARSDDDDSLLNKSSTARRGDAGSRVCLPEEESRSRSTESNKADLRAGSDAWSRSCNEAESFLRRLSRFLTKRLTLGRA